MGPTPPPPAQWLIPQILVKPVAQVLAVASTASWSRPEAKSTSQPAQSDKCHSAICHTLFACRSARIIIGSQSPLGGLGGWWEILKYRLLAAGPGKSRQVYACLGKSSLKSASPQ